MARRVHKPAKHSRTSPTNSRRVSATDAARTFSDLLSRVHYRGETVVVERGGTPICEIVPAQPLRFMLSDLTRLLGTVGKPDPEYWDTLEALARDQPVVRSSPWER